MTRFRSDFVGQGSSLVFYNVLRVLVFGLAKAWFRLSVSGRHHLPVSGPFIIAPVHRSNLDTPLVGCSFGKRVRFMGKDSLWKGKWAGKFLSALGGFPVSRGTADREAIKRSLAVLQSGEPLVLFPEGERKSGPTVQPLFDGVAYLACKERVQIVPVGIGGSERAMHKGSKFVRPTKIHIEIGAPIDTASRVPAGKRAGRDVIDSISGELSTQLQILFDRAQQKVG
jgi:1-acyl-sn-glycerol-3-phosphate acyltransferase